MRPDEYLDDDEEDGFSSRSIFASGWFRALMVLGVLGIILVVTLPYAFKWMEAPKPALAKRDAAPSSAARPAPATPSAVPPSVVPVAVPTPGPPPAAAEKPTVASAPLPAPQTAPAEAPAPLKASAEKPTPAKPASTAKAPSEAPSAEKPAPPAKPVAPLAEATVGTASPVRKSATAPAPRPAAAAEKGGDFWVQVGVFQDERNAERLAKTLRAKHLPAHVTKLTREATAPTTRHEVFVTGANPQVVNAALRGNGSALPVRGGVAVQPSLELKEAVALSRKLSGEGLNVQIRRVGGDAAPAAGVRHLVRVGGYATRGEAQAVRNQLKRDGVSAFVTPVATQ